MNALRAGVAEVDVTPEMGIQLAGDIGRPRPVEKIRDPLYAKALVLEASGKRLCYVAVDCAVMTDRWAAEIRAQAQKKFGLPPESVMVHLTQNHSAPAIGHFMCRDECTLVPPEHAWLRAGDERYETFAVERIVRSIGEACARLAPAKVGAESEVDSRVAFNRRFVLRDGTVRCNPQGADRLQILHVEGPMDPEVGVISVADARGQPQALVLHHTCHPTHGYPTRVVSADWCGEWATAMKQSIGKQCVPLIANGCCGNIIHMNFASPRAGWSNDALLEDQQRMGSMLAESATKAMSRIQYTDDVSLDFASRRVKIPLRKLTDDELTGAQKMLREHPTPKWCKNAPECVEWDWVYAVTRLDLHDYTQKNSHDDYEIQVFRIGDTALVAVQGEPFVEGQLEIKKNSPARHTYFAHMSNGMCGYVPTRQAFKSGGYETWTSWTSRFAPEALEMISAESVSLLKELFGK
jgi:hypothetical protein